METRLWKGLEDRLADAGLPRLGSVETMNVIASGRQVRPLDVATALVITPGAATKIIERLVQARMLERVASTDDRRSHTLRLTDRGESALADSSDLADKYFAEHWPADERFDAFLAAYRNRLLDR
ncbi:MarR family winged helix-turn-helix transcriptional regulator [Tsukamurella tyrosinosolvens]|uniref:MarR family winged helix-turn-helix transcriptional regulator n=1 Tax=Tsukamurella tyrosinosolvens TaxID=57704 RepID=UPI001476F71E|nr:MarR family transcriptional regulator [Tsukamurella tyrosinosolvens]